MKRDDSGGAVWEVVVALLMVLVAAVAFAQQADMGKDKDKDHGPKRVIHGKPADRHAIEMLLDESEGDAEVSAGKTISMLKGRFKLDKSKPVEEAAVDFIDRHRNAFGLKNPKEELKLSLKKKPYLEEEGAALLSFQQMYNGIPIWQKSFGVHVNGRGEITEMGSNAVIAPDLDTNPLVSADEALSVAKSSFTTPDEYMELLTNTLVIYTKTKDYKLAYYIQLIEKSERYDIFVDAKTGRVISKANTTKYFEPTEGFINRTGVLSDGSLIGVTVYNHLGRTFLTHGFPNISGTQPPNLAGNFVPPGSLPIDNNSTRNSFRNNRTISAWDGRSGEYTQSIFMNATSGDPNLRINPTRGGLDSGVNILHNHDVVFNYFKSIDDNFWCNANGSFGGVANTVSFGSGLRSSWNGGYASYGPGGTENGVTRTDITKALDIAAHEMGHGVTEKMMNGLDSGGQPGSLNEHISDLWAIMVDDRNWTIGEDSFTGGKCRRDFSTPKSGNQWPPNGITANEMPSNMDEFVYTSLDNFGEHINVCILNFAAYNLIQNIGRERTARLYYKAYEYFTNPEPKPNAHFIDLRDALVSASRAIDTPAEGPINAAFSSVGITDLPVKEVIQYDNGTGGSSQNLSQNYLGYGSLFIPYYREVEGVSKSVLAGAKIKFKEGDGSNNKAFVRVLAGTPSDTGAIILNERYSTEVEVKDPGDNKFTFVDLGQTVVGDPFYITVQTDPPGTAGLALAYENSGTKPNVKKVGLKTALTSSNYEMLFNDDVYLIRPIIVYNDYTTPESKFNAPPSHEGVRFSNHTAYYGKKHFTNATTPITITGTAWDKYNGTEDSGVKDLILTMNSGTEPQPVEDTSDDASWSTWKYVLKNLVDGTYNIIATAKDMLDNPQAEPAKMTVVVDRTT